MQQLSHSATPINGTDQAYAHIVQRTRVHGKSKTLCPAASPERYVIRSQKHLPVSQ